MVARLLFSNGRDSFGNCELRKVFAWVAKSLHFDQPKQSSPEERAEMDAAAWLNI